MLFYGCIKINIFLFLFLHNAQNNCLCKMNFIYLVYAYSLPGDSLKHVKTSTPSKITYKIPPVLSPSGQFCSFSVEISI